MRVLPEAFHPSASHVNPDYRDGWNQCHKEFTAALALPDAEPVAWAIFAENRLIRIWDNKQPHLQRMADEQGLSLVKLYAAPQPAIAPEPVRLTDAEIKLLWDACMSGVNTGYKDFARAIESAIHAKRSQP